MIRLVVVLTAGLVAGIGAAQADPSVPIPAPAIPMEGAASDQGSAEPPGAANAAGRYTFHRVGEGFVRLDSRTGHLSQCGSRDGIWSCTVAPDEREALESEIARLRQENVALKKTLLARGIDLPSGIAPEARMQGGAPVPPADVPDPRPRPPKGPSEADIDGIIAYMKNVWRKLVDMMLDLQRDVQRKI